MEGMELDGTNQSFSVMSNQISLRFTFAKAACYIFHMPPEWSEAGWTMGEGVGVEQGDSHQL